MKATYRVGGMTCSSCINAVTRAIKRLDHTAEVSAELASGKVSVAGAIAKDAVKRAVEGAGFTFVE